MSEKNENKVEKVETKEAASEIVVEEKEPIVKKVLKWTVKGLVLAVTFVGGIILGKNLTGSDDNDADDNSETTEE